MQNMLSISSRTLWNASPFPSHLLAVSNLCAVISRSPSATSTNHCLDCAAFPQLTRSIWLFCNATLRSVHLSSLLPLHLSSSQRRVVTFKRDFNVLSLKKFLFRVKNIPATMSSMMGFVVFACARKFHVSLKSPLGLGR
jgi:hypothetical protein